MDVGHEIGRKHFEEAFAGARRSVANNDLAKFDQFRRKFDPLYKQGQGEGMPCNGQTSPLLEEPVQRQWMTTTICMHEVVEPLGKFIVYLFARLCTSVGYPFAQDPAQSIALHDLIHCALSTARRCKGDFRVPRIPKK